MRSLSQSVDAFPFHFRLVCRWDEFICKSRLGKWNKAFNRCIMNWQICPVHYLVHWFHMVESLFPCALPLEGTEYISIHLHVYSFNRLNKLSCYFCNFMGNMICIQGHRRLVCAFSCPSTNDRSDSCNLYENMSIWLNYQSVKFSHLHLLPNISSLRWIIDIWYWMPFPYLLSYSHYS